MVDGQTYRRRGSLRDVLVLSGQRAFAILIQEQRSGGLGIDDDRHNQDRPDSGPRGFFRGLRQRPSDSLVRSNVRHFEHRSVLGKIAGKLEIQAPELFPFHRTYAVRTVVAASSHPAFIANKNRSALQVQRTANLISHTAERRGEVLRRLSESRYLVDEITSARLVLAVREQLLY